MENCQVCHNLNPPEAAFCLRCGSAVGASGQASPPSSPVDDATDQPLDLTGQTLGGGRYQVVQQLGVGGMGTVYRATDTRLRRDVALKVLHAELVAHPTAKRRMVQEAEALARIEHPNVVRMFDVFDEGPMLVMVLELITGGDLTAMVRPGGVGEPTATAVLRGVLAGLQAIHDGGLVHRDVKPANVLLSPQGVPKIVDLGIAQDAQAKEKTQLGARLGTPDYMSPEQVQGLRVDRRADVYAAGMVFYELLTGRKPYDATTDFDIAAAHVRVPPNMQALAGKASPTAQAVVAKALAKNPDDRFESTSAMAAALDAQITVPQREASGNAEPVLANKPAATQHRPRTPTAPQQAVRQVQPPKASSMGLIVGVVVAAVALAAVGVAVSSGGPSPSGSGMANPASGQSPSPTPSPSPSPAATEAAAAPAAPAAFVFIPAPGSCGWTGSYGTSWLYPGQTLSLSLANHGHAFTQLSATRMPRGTLAISGPTPVSIDSSARELLTAKTWAPGNGMEWVVAFWYGDSAGAAVTITRLKGQEATTREFPLPVQPVSDVLDGHYLRIKYEPDQRQDTCIVFAGTDNGEITSKMKSAGIKAKHTWALTLDGDVADLGGDW